MERFIDGNLKISVRNLVEFVLRSGDIDNRRTSVNEKEAMQEGSRIHRKIQGRMGTEYTPEVPLKITVSSDRFSITVEGRADGIINKKDIVIIDEIKGMYSNVMKFKEPIGVHKAQAMCYAYIYAEKNGLERIGIQMTYCNLDSEEIKRFNEIFEYEELKEWFADLIQSYSRWVEFLYDNLILRQESIENLQFPFEYRKGQRDIVVSVFKTVRQKKDLYIQAPTGVGKTMSVIFPAVRAMGEGSGDKIFYLTAKTITRTVAEEAFRLLKSRGLHFRNVTITAKDKICIFDKPECNPEKCERAKGHFDRINDAVFDIINSENEITRDVILQYAQKHNVCPFEMNLDCTNWCDGIICDYNYVYDPTVRLKRYFSDGVKGDYIVLVDEAHNLVERAREMYSATLYKDDFLSIKKIVKDKSKAVYNALGRCNKELLAYRKEGEDREYYLREDADSLIKQLLRLQGYMKKFLDDFREFDGRESVMDFYFDFVNFLNIYELVDDKYEIFTEDSKDKGFLIKLFCVNPSGNVSRCMQQCLSTIFFSATLLPVNYYKELLGGKTDDYAIYINSPFQQDKRLIFIATDVSSRYNRRNITEYQKMAEYIRVTAKMCKGNYMVFFPSYKLMDSVYQVLEPLSAIDGFRYILQENKMDEQSREEFLESFREDADYTLIGLCVLGGVFSEGIDLKNERLIGTIVVGTGLPQICTEKQILKSYYDENGRNGFDYAYRYPGINKVLQAAGRVIRTQEDYGVIGLLDDRFLETSYSGLYPREWDDVKCVNIKKAEEEIRRFWKYL
ncbi:MAG: ATP-dependent DNA helicase [Lachnospiraceae bacterium]|nr:ATP-dependent DNA helicase [Lachnospiraceae bacterium]